MPDISMCSGKHCPIRESCYRYTAIPSRYGRQSYADFAYNKELKKCGYYWNNETSVKITLKKDAR